MGLRIWWSFGPGSVAIGWDAISPLNILKVLVKEISGIIATFVSLEIELLRINDKH